MDAEPCPLGPAVVIPLVDQAEDRVVGVLVLGAEPLLTFDDAYRGFFLTAADTIAGKAAESHARVARVGGQLRLARVRRRTAELKAALRASEERLRVALDATVRR
jgi:hypothetical protein